MKTKITFVSTVWRDYMFGQNTDRAIVKRINNLIDAIVRDPFTGIGKPEPLRHHLSGAWSRRITDEQRLVYLVEDTNLIIISCRYHYER